MKNKVFSIAVFTVTLFAAIAIFSSCSDDDSNDGPKTEYLFKTYIVNPTTPVTKKLTTENEFNQSDLIIKTKTYDTITGNVKTYTKYIYNTTNKVSTIEYYNSSDVKTGYDVYTYAQDLISKYDTYLGTLKTYNCSFTYLNNKITKITQSLWDTTALVPVNYTDLTYNSKNNITKAVTYSLVTLTKESEVVYTYDDKINYLNSLSIPKTDIASISKNNITVELKTSYNIQGQITTTEYIQYAYEYDSNNYPVKKTIIQADKANVVSELEYK